MACGDFQDSPNFLKKKRCIRIMFECKGLKPWVIDGKCLDFYGKTTEKTCDRKHHRASESLYHDSQKFRHHLCWFVVAKRILC